MLPIEAVRAFLITQDVYACPTCHSCFSRQDHLTRHKKTVLCHLRQLPYGREFLIDVKPMRDDYINDNDSDAYIKDERDTA